MRYMFKIEIHPVVNHHTKAAEFFVCNDEYDGLGKGLVTRQKHLGNFDTIELAEKHAEDFCQNLRDKMEHFIKQESQRFSNAKP